MEMLHTGNSKSSWKSASQSSADPWAQSSADPWAQSSADPWAQSSAEPWAKKLKSSEDFHDEFCTNNFKLLKERKEIETEQNKWTSLTCHSDKEINKMNVNKYDDTGVRMHPLPTVDTESRVVTTSCIPLEEVDVTGDLNISVAGSAEIKMESNDKSLPASEEDEVKEFGTSKVFIGPLCRPVESSKSNCSRNCNELGKDGENITSGLHSRRTQKMEASSKPCEPCNKNEIDDELCQFYKELQQIDEDGDHGDSLQGNEQNVIANLEEPAQEALSAEGKCENMGIKLQENQCGIQYFDQQFLTNDPSAWRKENQSSKQMEATVWNSNFSLLPPLRSEWEQAPSFIVPQVPPPPFFSLDFNLLKHIPPPPLPGIFHSQSDGPYHNSNGGYHGNNYSTNWNCAQPAQNSSCDDQSGRYSMQAFENGHTDQPHGYMSNGFSETKDRHLEDTFAYEPKESNTLSCEQNPSVPREDKLWDLNKLLILLRGVPGSGKTTLAHVLLDQNPDGTVLSTDDYFHHEDGYTYDVSLLGDAHEWNQNRAKEAMDEGISPVIIDNTNIQRWEMKPYVEMAIEKGYRVQFHEPETWWKLDAGELEKKNKHGVPREKIVQMLDRYEHYVSITNVLNSVEPPHKSAQRTPAQQKQRKGIRRIYQRKQMPSLDQIRFKMIRRITPRTISTHVPHNPHVDGLEDSREFIYRGIASCLHSGLHFKQLITEPSQLEWQTFCSWKMLICPWYTWIQLTFLLILLIMFLCSLWAISVASIK
ncbi:NEDD4-binding protein 2-like 2 isoform X2 [Rhinatrema bivittatum]|uniref:NEDD4-binding protein 2-like 2 isoform X2 n=1 Tax=Rhinatrema bivittatum TaxID=194408 RepID=UPI00112736BB|nr:NEDD4-binding protein 2-like 2 isoform X2 [Rhinatrema bivittatum]